MLAEMVPSVEVEEARSAQEKAESEMRKLTRLLSQAGLSDTTVLTNFVQSVVGPPQQDIAQLTVFLLFICDKQYRLQQLAQFSYLSLVNKRHLVLLHHCSNLELL